MDLHDELLEGRWLMACSHRGLDVKATDWPASDLIGHVSHLAR